MSRDQETKKVTITTNDDGNDDNSSKTAYTDYSDRKMNDSTMAPTHREGDLTISTSSNTAVRAKVRIKKGFGLSDWNRLVRVSQDLAQRQGAPLRKDITWDEVRQHNSLYDGWVVLKNKVYMVSPYLAYHPGGEGVIKRILGKDITKLYNHYHQWVNEENLIGKLLIGYLDTSSKAEDEEDRPKSYLPTMAVSSAISTQLTAITNSNSNSKKTSDGFSMPPPPSKLT